MNHSRSLPRIFISYRRQDSENWAEKIYDELISHFGADMIFRDIDSIEAGEDFTNVTLKALQGCDVMLVFIGPNWLNIRDSAGEKRIDDPKDFVRMEIEYGLNRAITLIPVLIDGTRMPESSILPANIKFFSRRQAVKISEGKFESDLETLVGVLQERLKEADADRTKFSRPPSITDYFDVILPVMLRRRGELASSLAAEPDCSIEFEVKGDNGGSWVVFFTKPKPFVQKGTVNKVDCKLSMTEETMQSILSGTFNAKEAIAQGKLTIQGDISVLKRVSFLF
ncbi:MAG: TIR domain-containing protein [bacterium]